MMLHNAVLTVIGCALIGTGIAWFVRAVVDVGRRWRR